MTEPSPTAGTEGDRLSRNVRVVSLVSFFQDTA